ncbi:MAG: lipid II flippase MurJ, partial [Bradyrhizobium sp.]
LVICLPFFLVREPRKMLQPSVLCAAVAVPGLLGALFLMTVKIGALPATLGLMVLSGPIVRMLFEHGAFTAEDSAATAQALTWLTLALPAHVLVKALSPAFFARE